MSVKQPFETLAAEAITGLIVTGGQKGDAAKIIRRANTALAVANAVAGIANGDPAPAIVQLQNVLASADLDPGVALAVQGLFSIGQQQLTLAASLGRLIPLVGSTADAVALNIAAGITSAAQAELAKYAPSQGGV